MTYSLDPHFTGKEVKEEDSFKGTCRSSSLTPLGLNKMMEIGKINPKKAERAEAPEV